MVQATLSPTLSHFRNCENVNRSGLATTSEIVDRIPNVLAQKFAESPRHSVTNHPFPSFPKRLKRLKENYRGREENLSATPAVPRNIEGYRNWKT